MSVGEILEREEGRPAYVRFERRAVKDPEATLQAGRHVSMDEDYALVTPPYSKDVVEKKVDAWFNQVEINVKSGRIPEKHLDLWKESYKRWLAGQEPPLDGTSVKDWSSISPAQCENLIRAGCRTIEDLAQANDEALRRLGMGGHELRNKAKAWLQAAKDHGPLTMEVAQLKNENKQLQGTIDALQEQIKLLEIRVEGQAELIPKAKSGFPINSSQVYNQSAPEQIVKSEDIAKAELRVMLIKEYESKFGKKPDGRMKNETIRKSLL